MISNPTLEEIQAAKMAGRIAYHSKASNPYGNQALRTAWQLSYEAEAKGSKV